MLNDQGLGLRSMDPTAQTFKAARATRGAADNTDRQGRSRHAPVLAPRPARQEKNRAGWQPSNGNVANANQSSDFPNANNATHPSFDSYIAIHGSDGKFLWSFPCGNSISVLGYPSHRIVTLSPYVLMHPCDIPAVGAIHRQITENLTPAIIYRHVRHAEGMFLRQVTLSIPCITQGRLSHVLTYNIHKKNDEATTNPEPVGQKSWTMNESPLRVKKIDDLVGICQLFSKTDMSDPLCIYQAIDGGNTDCLIKVYRYIVSEFDKINKENTNPIPIDASPASINAGLSESLRSMWPGDTQTTTDPPNLWRPFSTPAVAAAIPPASFLPTMGIPFLGYPTAAAALYPQMNPYLGYVYPNMSNMLTYATAYMQSYYLQGVLSQYANQSNAASAAQLLQPISSEYLLPNAAGGMAGGNTEIENTEFSTGDQHQAFGEAPPETVSGTPNSEGSTDEFQYQQAPVFVRKPGFPNSDTINYPFPTPNRPIGSQNTGNTADSTESVQPERPSSRASMHSNSETASEIRDPDNENTETLPQLPDLSQPTYPLPGASLRCLEPGEATSQHEISHMDPPDTMSWENHQRPLENYFGLSSLFPIESNAQGDPPTNGHPHEYLQFHPSGFNGTEAPANNEISDSHDLDHDMAPVDVSIGSPHSNLRHENLDEPERERSNETGSSHPGFAVDTNLQTENPNAQSQNPQGEAGTFENPTTEHTEFLIDAADLDEHMGLGGDGAAGIPFHRQSSSMSDWDETSAGGGGVQEQERERELFLEHLGTWLMGGSDAVDEFLGLNVQEGGVLHEEISEENPEQSISTGPITKLPDLPILGSPDPTPAPTNYAPTYAPSYAESETESEISTTSNRYRERSIFLTQFGGFIASDEPKIAGEVEGQPNSGGGGGEKDPEYTSTINDDHSNHTEADAPVFYGFPEPGNRDWGRHVFISRLGNWLESDIPDVIPMSPAANQTVGDERDDGERNPSDVTGNREGEEVGEPTGENENKEGEKNSREDRKEEGETVDGNAEDPGGGTEKEKDESAYWWRRRKPRQNLDEYNPPFHYN